MVNASVVFTKWVFDGRSSLGYALSQVLHLRSILKRRCLVFFFYHLEMELPIWSPHLNRCFCISEERVFSFQWLELELSFKISRNALPDEVD